jgi:SanA protein
MFLKLLKYGLLALFVTLLFIFLIDLWVQTSTSEQIFTSVEEMPKNKVGLLLGTRKMLRSGYI